MINLRNTITFLFGCLVSTNVLATDLIEDKNSNERFAKVSLREDLIHELENERRREDQLSRESTRLLVECREVFLFQDTQQIIKILTSPEHPYKINMTQLLQCRQRIDDLKTQLCEMGYEEEYIFIKVFFPKPNINRFGGAPVHKTQITGISPHR